MNYFKQLINICVQMNHTEFKSEQFYKYRQELDEILNERKKNL